VNAQVQSSYRISLETITVKGAFQPVHYGNGARSAIPFLDVQVIRYETTLATNEEWRFLGCYAVWLFKN
jgi:hypothetical protein